MLYLSQFNGTKDLYSFAYTEGALQEILHLKHNAMALLDTGSVCRLYPECREFAVTPQERERLLSLHDFDVLQPVGEGCLYPIYSAASPDNAIVVTQHCNSNCLMCPVPEKIRREEEPPTLEELLRLADYIPSDTPHLTITGGEPFLIGDPIFVLLSYLRQTHPETEYQILTNGRIFAVPEMVSRFMASRPDGTSLGIPLHGPSAEIHDAIVQSKGAFRQTVTGVRNLLARGEKVDLRFVVSGLNHTHITEMAEFVARYLPEAASVKVMGLEMTGNAAVNRERVWIPYEEAFQDARQGIDLLIREGIDVELFNFPLCTVDPGYWGLCCRSITDTKVTYAPDCASCQVRSQCGGIFHSSKNFVKQVHPVSGDRA